MNKHPDWRSRVQTLINSKNGKNLAWGEFDCFTFMDECYEAFYGEHLLNIQGNYSTLAGAVRYYNEVKESFGMDDVIVYLDSKFPRNETPYLMAGDIVARREPDGESSVFGYAFGVAIDRNIAFVSTEGLVFYPRSPIDFVWRP